MWQPPEELRTNCQMAQFMRKINEKFAKEITDYASLHQWSIDNPEQFWIEVAAFCQIKASHPPDRILLKTDKMENTRWFQGATLNFAENLLSRSDTHTAIIYCNEPGEKKQLTYGQLQAQVAKLADYLKHLGVKAQDRVVGFLPNSPETIIAMLATTSIGAIWSSCSPDFGFEGLLDRFGQIDPVILFAVDSHVYNGKTFQHFDKIKRLIPHLQNLKKIIIVPYFANTTCVSGDIANSIFYPDIFNQYKQTPALHFQQLPFDHPIYILYSSGTTGKPKCMVHGAGGTLLQHLKELRLHTDLRANEKICFYTTCGWMMWNWVVSSLAVGATLVLYDGSPFYPKNHRFFDWIDEVGINVFGIGAKFFEASEKKHVELIKTHHLSSLRTLLTTGSPLLPESFDYIYQKIKPDICVSSISGGSDIISCFALGNPMLPVYRGELQCAGLGMDVKVFDDAGQSTVQQKGELVCRSPFPSMPIYFWNDPDRSLYHKAYFEKYPNVWAQGDYAEITEHNGIIIYGRSDATLNPGGIRIGTAEIYHQVEKIDAVLDCLAVGQEWEGSERVILFVVLRENALLTDHLIETIKSTIKSNTSSHHIPAKIIAVPDLPRTISGKTVELVVKNILNNKPVKNISVLANPESLDYFRDLSELSRAPSSKK